VSDELKELLGQMLTHDFNDRIMAKDALKNPWFQNVPKKIIDVNLLKEGLGEVK
jgi:hypothetical protein